MLDARKDILGFFEKGTFPSKGNVFKTRDEKLEEQSEDESEEESEEEKPKNLSNILRINQMV